MVDKGPVIFSRVFVGDQLLDFHELIVCRRSAKEPWALWVPSPGLRGLMASTVGMESRCLSKCLFAQAPKPMLMPSAWQTAQVPGEDSSVINAFLY